MDRHAARLVTRREPGELRLMSYDVSPETNAKIGGRLKRLRHHLGYKTQTAFAKVLEIEPNRLNQYERGTRFLTLEVALLIRERTSCPLDYLYFGDTHGLPAFLRDLAHSEAA